jgi:hypothetical protein
MSDKDDDIRSNITEGLDITKALVPVLSRASVVLSHYYLMARSRSIKNECQEGLLSSSLFIIKLLIEMSRESILILVYKISCPSIQLSTVLKKKNCSRVCLIDNLFIITNDNIIICLIWYRIVPGFYQKIRTGSFSGW